MTTPNERIESVSVPAEKAPYIMRLVETLSAARLGWLLDQVDALRAAHGEDALGDDAVILAWLRSHLDTLPA